MQQLILTAKEFTSLGSMVRWHWRLVQPKGKLVADGPGQVDQAAWEYQAFTDLYGWLERPGADAEQILPALGQWLTRTVLGDLAPALAAQSCAVRLWQESPAPLDATSLPFELATVNGRPLAEQNVSFVIAPDDPLPDSSALSHAGPPPLPASEGQLRVLALFSLPDGRQSLNLSKERHELERLVTLLRGNGRAISLTALQYGTTRDSLRRALEEGPGWDVVHLSGHGQAGVFVLEKPDGSPDRIAGDDLIDLLIPGLRDRVRLVTVSACESAERAGRRQLVLLPGGTAPPGLFVGASPAGAGDGESSLALRLARDLRCSVLGMRYPVAEHFAAGFTHELYRLMLDKGRSLPEARSWAAASKAARPATPECPPLSLITPALYGARGLTLALRAPDRNGPPSFGYAATKMAGVPGGPPRFVGRAGPMIKVAAALAPESGRAAVVVEGMDLIGKTALALETAHAQSGNFEVIAWNRVNADDDPVDGLARMLRAKVPGLDPSPLRGTSAQAQDFADGLSAYFATKVRAFIVIDGAEAQLTGTGQWRNERMALLVTALAGHHGLTRVLITSRRPLADASQWPARPVTLRLGPLPEGDAALLSSEFPGLKALRDGDGHALRPPLDADSARGLAMAVLAATRGHPELLAIAAQHCGDPVMLSQLTITARTIWAAGDVSPEAAYRTILNEWRSV